MSYRQSQPSNHLIPLGSQTVVLKRFPQKKKKKESGLPAKMEVLVDTLRLLAQPKEGQQQFKNKKQPELTEN